MEKMRCERRSRYRPVQCEHALQNERKSNRTPKATYRLASRGMGHEKTPQNFCTCVAHTSLTRRFDFRPAALMLRQPAILIQQWHDALSFKRTKSAALRAVA